MLAQQMFVEAAFCRNNDNNMVKMTAMTSCKYSGHKIPVLFTTPVIFAVLPEEKILGQMLSLFILVP